MRGTDSGGAVLVRRIRQWMCNATSLRHRRCCAWGSCWPEGAQPLHAFTPNLRSSHALCACPRTLYSQSTRGSFVCELTYTHAYLFVQFVTAALWSCVLPGCLPPVSDYPACCLIEAVAMKSRVQAFRQPRMHKVPPASANCVSCGAAQVSGARDALVVPFRLGLCVFGAIALFLAGTWQSFFRLKKNAYSRHSMQSLLPEAFVWDEPKVSTASSSAAFVHERARL